MCCSSLPVIPRSVREDDDGPETPEVDDGVTLRVDDVVNPRVDDDATACCWPGCVAVGGSQSDSSSNGPAAEVALKACFPVAPGLGKIDSNFSR